MVSPREVAVTADPIVTIAVPSFNQGQYLDQALSSIFMQDVAVEVFVLDNGSSDNSVEIIKKWAPQLAGWRSHKDAGQAAAINEGIAEGTAPYVCWLNSDDLLMPDSLKMLVGVLEEMPAAPLVYGRAWNLDDKTKRLSPVWVEDFSAQRLAVRCFISQPATLMRRTAWEELCGLDEALHMAMDYDLWWRMYKSFGPLKFVDRYTAANRLHKLTKTRLQRRAHYKEAISIVRKHNGAVPWKWWLIQPYAVWWKSLVRSFDA